MLETPQRMAAPSVVAPPMAAAAESTKHLLIFGLIAGVLTALTVSTFFLPEPTASNALSSYESNTGAYDYGLGVLLLLVIGATPFIASLGSLLVTRGRGLVWAAMLLSVVGLLGLAIRAGLFLGALYSIANTPSTQAGMDAYEAAIWWGVGNNLNLVGILAWGVGLLLFGLAAWNSRILPNWLALVGVIGGASSLILFIPFVAFVLLPVAFGIWCFAAPIVVWRTRTITPADSPD